MTLFQWLVMVENMSRFGGDVVRGEQYDSVVVLGQSGRKERFLILWKWNLEAGGSKGKLLKMLTSMMAQFMISLATLSRKPIVKCFWLVSVQRTRLIFLCGGSRILQLEDANLVLHRFYLLFHLSSSLNSSYPQSTSALLTLVSMHGNTI